MQAIRFFYALLIAVVLLSSCQRDKKYRSEEILAIDSVISPLSGISWMDTLAIVVRFSECGEWGGHLEYFKIQQDGASKLCARLVIDSANCDSLIRYSGTDMHRSSRHRVYDSIKQLTLEDEYLISEMLQRILEANLKFPTLANFGDSYVITTSNKTFDLRFWNAGNYHVIGYAETRDKIFNDRGSAKN